MIALEAATESPAIGVPMFASMSRAAFKRAKQRYREHKQNSFARKIGFKFDFVTWIGAWMSSYKWLQRGRRRGQFVMGRPGDRGDYELGNIIFITNGENVGGPHIGKPLPEAVKAKMSATKKGVPSKLKGRKKTAATRRRMRVGCKKRHDGEWRERVRLGGLAAWAARRAAGWKSKKNEPWKAAGVSQTTYYRRRRAAEV